MSESFCVTLPKNFLVELFCVWETFWCQKILSTRDGQVSRSSIEIVLPHSTEKTLVDPPLFQKKLGYSKKFKGIRENLGGITIFWNSFVPQYRNNSSRNPSVLCFRIFTVAKKFRDNRGEKGRKDHHDFLSKTCLTVTRNFAGESFGVSENLGCRKTSCLRGVCHDSLEFFFSQSTEKNCSWTLLCFRKVLASKNVKD